MAKEETAAEKSAAKQDDQPRATLRVKHKNYGDEIIVIAERDFDPDLHSRIDEPVSQAKAKEAPPKSA